MLRVLCSKTALIASLSLNILFVVIQTTSPQEIKRFIFHDSKLLFRNKVNCPKDAFTLAFFGQSNAANHIPSRKHIKNDDIYMYNYMNRACYEYSEPVIGASGTNGNVMTDLALQLKTSLNKPIVIIAFGESGSSVLEWQYGKYKDKLDQVLRSGSQLRGGIRFFLWHQGETDAIQGMGEEAYFDTLAKIIIRSQLFFPESNFGVSIASRCGKYISESIRKAQYRSTLMPHVFKAADSDSFPSKYRHDGCHLNREGSQALAREYFKSIILNIR